MAASAQQEITQEVTPEFLEQTRKYDEIGHELDGLNARAKELKQEYKAIEENIAKYMIEKDLPRLETATGRSTVGRVQRVKQGSINEQLVATAARNVGVPEEVANKIWGEMKRIRPKEKFVKIHRIVLA